MQHQCFRKQGQLRRTKFIFPVMADNKVLNQNLELRGEAGQVREFRLQHFQLDNHVPQQLAARGVRKRPVVSKLVNLADVVQERASEKQITINLRIIPAHKIAGTEQRDHVIEQSTNISR